jgi:hypothetical protein
MIEDRRRRVYLVAGVFAIILSGGSSASAGETFQPRSGQLGKDVVWVGNPEAMVQKMLDVAGVTPQDYVVDLGSGDGRNVIAAAKRGARAHGVEYNADLVELSKSLAAKERVSERATFERGDVFEADFSKATVVVLFLTPEMNIRLRPKLLALKPGARIVANTFAIGDWNPDQSFSATQNCEKFCSGRMWIVPAKVAGRWKLPDGELAIKQIYQSFSGTLTSGSITAPISGRLRGDQIAFSAGGTQYTGKVDGAVIEGFARKAGVDSRFRGTFVSR